MSSMSPKTDKLPRSLLREADLLRPIPQLHIRALITLKRLCGRPDMQGHTCAGLASRLPVPDQFRFFGPTEVRSGAVLESLRRKRNRAVLSAAGLLLAVAKGMAAQECVGAGVSPTMYRRLLSEQFVNVASPASSNSIGNFASYSSADGTITFSGRSVLANDRVVVVKASGSGADGRLGILSAGEPSGNVSVSTQVHLLTSRQSLIYTLSSCVEHDRLERAAMQAYDQRMLQLDSNAASLEALRRIVRLQGDTATRARLIERSRLARPVSKIDSLMLDSLLLEQAVAVLAIQVARRDTGRTTDTQRLAARNERARALQQADKAYVVRGFKISWWSLGVGFASNSFRRFDSTAVVASQLTSKSFVSPEVNVQYATYSLGSGPWSSWYLSVGARATNTDNFDALDKMELSETSQYGVNVGDRQRTKKVTAYAGDYRRNVKSLTFLADAYIFALGDQRAAFHVYPSFILAHRSKPETNTGVGFLLLYKNAEGTSNLVNAEVFVELNDLANVNQSELSAWKRGQLGLRFTLPLTFTAKE